MANASLYAAIISYKKLGTYYASITHKTKESSFEAHFCFKKPRTGFSK